MGTLDVALHMLWKTCSGTDFLASVWLLGRRSCLILGAETQKPCVGLGASSAGGKGSARDGKRAAAGTNLPSHCL